LRVITVPNLLEPEKSFVNEHDFNSVIDYLLFQYPDGFKVPHVIYYNNKKLEVDDYDIKCGDNDFITIAFSPAAPLIAFVTPYLINFAIAAAVSYVIGEIFKPDIPSGALSSDQKSLGQQSSVYNLNSNQNVTRLGQKRPILYGRTRSYFSLIEQPYYRFKDNEMFLYQMMAVSEGDAIIEELLIADTPEEDLGTEDVVYKSYQEDSFSAGVIKADVLSLFGDDDYHMRVKTLPEISGLELRGTPASSFFRGYFSGSVITFQILSTGDYPDLTSLVNGSTIVISNSDSNDGTYLVDTADDIAHTITVQSTTFVTEPSSSEIIASEVGATIFSNNNYIREFEIPNTVFTNIIVGNYYSISFGSTIYDDVLCTGKSEVANGLYHTYFNKIFSVGTNTEVITLTNNSSLFNAEFQTSYGAYTLENIPSTLDSVEIDVEYPRGVYNSDASGNFTDREISLEYKMIGSLETNWSNLNTAPDAGWPAGTTEQAKDNTPLRRSYNLPIPDGLTDDVPLKIRLRRSSAEVADIKSQDQAIVTRVKSIYNEPDITAYGNMTILWVRAKASNAISSAGQFQINGWVTRTDVAPDLTSVITDLYTNTDYGAGLNGTDLVLPTMNAPETIDSATDTGFVEVTAGTYYGIDDTGLPCPPGGTKVAVFWDSVKVLDSICVDSADPSGQGYLANTIYLSDVDNWYYMIETEMDAFFVDSKVRRFKYLDSSNYVEFNGAIDTKITVMDAIRMIAKAGRYNVYLDGQNVKVRRDEVQLVRTALFNETNMIKDSFKLDYLFGEDDGYNGVSVKYRSPTDFKEDVATFPSDATNPEVLELIGCTDQVLALAEATYGWLQKESRRKVASFSTDIQGILPNYLDRIGVTHNTPEWGLSSNVVAVNGNQITINCQLFGSDEELGICTDELGLCADVFCKGFSENLDYDTIIFRNKDGSVSDIYSFTIIGRYDIVLDQTPPIWLYTGYDYDKTPFSIGVSNKFVKDYIVTEIAPRGNNVIDIKAINYDPTVYEPVPLVDGFDNILVDGAGNELY